MRMAPSSSWARGTRTRSSPDTTRGWLAMSAASHMSSNRVPPRNTLATNQFVDTEERKTMYVRVVRFTDVDNERVDVLLARIDEAGGPPPGVATTGLTI